jgi:transformation/transcription domain-associated protein
MCLLSCCCVSLQAFTHLQEVNSNLHQLGYRDKAWAVNKLGMISTLHGLPDTSLSVLNTMYGYNAMEVQEVRGTRC